MRDKIALKQHFFCGKRKESIVSLLSDRGRALERKLHMQRMRTFKQYQIPSEVRRAITRHERTLRVAITQCRIPEGPAELVRSEDE